MDSASSIDDSPGRSRSARFTDALLVEQKGKGRRGGALSNIYIYKSDVVKLSILFAARRLERFRANCPRLVELSDADDFSGPCVGRFRVRGHRDEPVFLLPPFQTRRTPRG